VANLPGVSAVGATRVAPGQTASDGSYWIDHVPAEPNNRGPQAIFSVVAPNTFSALGIRVVRGRDFQTSDTFDAPRTAIINEALARESFGNQDPLGHLIICGFDSPDPMMIVGVVSDIHQKGPARAAEAELY